MLDKNKVYHGDCMELMQDIEDDSIDMILCDLPYGVLACSWDSILPMDELWKHYKRVIKKNGAIVLTATNPFSSMLVTSHPKGFKHEWIWEKNRVTGFQVAKYKPMQQHEHVLVFTGGGERVNYYPLMEKRDKPLTRKGSGRNNDSKGILHGGGLIGIDAVYTHRYPKSITKHDREQKGEYSEVHPTQKPVSLMQYLIETYSKPGELILDNCFGSGTTGAACIRSGRDYIGMEQDKGYYDLSVKRMAYEVGVIEANSRKVKSLWRV